MTTACALIIDDEADIRELIAMTISRMGLDYHTAANLEEAHNLLQQYRFDVCLTDMRLPDGNGVDFVSTLQNTHPALPVAVITAHGNMEAAVVAMKNGAYDFVSKPVDIAQLRKLVTTAIASGARGQQALDAERDTDKDTDLRLFNASNDADVKLNLTKAEIGNASPPPDGQRAPVQRVTDVIDTGKLIGNSAQMLEVRRMIGRLACTNAPVWITGESGTGKELIARLIHQNSARREREFVPINCGAIPSELMESELFGHRKGSFTGAISDHDGLFRKAEGGTLFFDEVAELPLQMQVKLLRAIQEKSVRAVGGSSETAVDVRILSASHKNLAHEVEQGRFRHDLYYRLNVINLRAPSLRERRLDIPVLAENFLARLSRANSSMGDNTMPENLPKLSSDAIQALHDYSFPGNVRELENILERALAMTDSKIIERSDLQLPQTVAAQPGISGHSIQPREHGSHSAGDKETSFTNPIFDDNARHETVHSGTLSEAPERDRQRIVEALHSNRWNRKAAAEQLGLTYRQLRYRIQQLRIDRDE